MFAADKTNVPDPTFSSLFPPLTIPLKVSVPEPPTEKLEVEVTLPESEAVPVPVSAPVEDMPVPPKVIALATAAPFILMAAPELTVVVLATAPKAVLLARLNVPLLTVVLPLKVFVPDSVSIPVPTFVKLILLVDVAVIVVLSMIRPANVVFKFKLPTVKLVTAFTVAGVAFILLEAALPFNAPITMGSVFS